MNAIKALLGLALASVSIAGCGSVSTTSVTKVPVAVTTSPNGNAQSCASARYALKSVSDSLTTYGHTDGSQINQRLVILDLINDSSMLNDSEEQANGNIKNDIHVLKMLVESFASNIASFDITSINNDTKKVPALVSSLNNDCGY